MPEPLLSAADWFASLPTVYLSASMLITDPADRILLVKPNYRPDWGIPGGIVEDGEAPDQCATREIAEELGLDIPAGDLLVVDWMAAAGERPQAIMNFLFDGGVLSDPGRHPAAGGGAGRRPVPRLGRSGGPDARHHRGPGARRPAGPAGPPHRLPARLAAGRPRPT